MAKQQGTRVEGFWVSQPWLSPPSPTAITRAAVGIPANSITAPSRLTSRADEHRHLFILQHEGNNGTLIIFLQMQWVKNRRVFTQKKKVLFLSSWCPEFKSCPQRTNERGGGSSGAACFPKIKEDGMQYSVHAAQGESHWDNSDNYCSGGTLFDVRREELGACSRFLCMNEFSQFHWERPLCDRNWNELMNSACEQKANPKLQAVSSLCCMASKEMRCILKI